MAETPPAAKAWHTLASDAVLQEQSTGPDGLSLDEAARRLVKFGPNAIETERVTPWWSLLLHQFRDPLIYILLAAAAATLAVK